MPQRSRTIAPDNGFMDLVRAIVSGDAAKAARLAAHSPMLVHERAATGATRETAGQYFLEAIRHYLYAGDTALHVAAAGHQCEIAQDLIVRGADASAKNRRGAEPLHRAVRTRCAAAVEALLAGGAEPRGKNKNGSTPLHLAVQNTGRGGSGTPHAIEQQRQIIVLLLRSGAKPEDKDGKGKAVREIAIADWMREIFRTFHP